MKKIIFLVFMVLFAGIVSAHSDEDFAQAEALIEQKVSCDELTEEQLELIGDYYMEQMHPGEAHEYMDAMMGGEGSESLRLMHINMALRLYCGENTGYGMMSGYSGMMGMMGYNYQNNYGFNWIMPLALTLIIVLLAVLIIKQKE